jgi:hypothetical protein
MLFPDQVRPFLLHEDELVRERALVHFAEAADRSLLNADELWAMVDRYGPVARPFHALGTATHTVASTDRLMRELGDGGAHPYLRTLQEAAAGLPLDQLETLLGRCGNAAEILGVSRDAAHRRLALSQKTPDALWTELAVQAEYCESQPDWGDAYYDGSKIVEALARFPDESTARLMELFAKEETRDRWLEVFLVDLAGELRHEPAAPHLLDIVSRDGDFVNERAAGALGRISSDDLVAQITERYPNATEPFRVYVPGALSAMRSSAAEAALARILPLLDDDLDRATFVADDLCDLATTVAYPGLVERVEDGRFAPWITSLDQHVLALAVMQGYELEWADECRQRRREEQRRAALRIAEVLRPSRWPAGPAVRNQSASTQWQPTSRKRKRRMGRKAR